MSEHSAGDADYLRRLVVLGHFHVGDVAELAQMSDRQLRRFIRDRFGCSLRDWLDGERLWHADSEFRSGKSTKQAASDLGFESTPSFCRWLRRIKGGR